jgi:hypothetical protein
LVGDTGAAAGTGYGVFWLRKRRRPPLSADQARWTVPGQRYWHTDKVRKRTVIDATNRIQIVPEMSVMQVTL